MYLLIDSIKFNVDVDMLTDVDVDILADVDVDEYSYCCISCSDCVLALYVQQQYACTRVSVLISKEQQAECSVCCWMFVRV